MTDQREVRNGQFNLEKWRKWWETSELSYLGWSKTILPIPQYRVRNKQLKNQNKAQTSKKLQSSNRQKVQRRLNKRTSRRRRSLNSCSGLNSVWKNNLNSGTSYSEYKLVRQTYLQLRHSGYYWGPMTMEEAHLTLTPTPLGTFLIRDSGQPDVFFTLSYQSNDGPTSVRVLLNNLLFSLYGSNRTFDSLFTLLDHYTSPPCKLTLPYRKLRPEWLKQICRRAFIRTHGAESLNTLPGLSTPVRAYVQAYPYSI
ncbi:suppressor of cytokine signaling 1-like isoform X2 [Gouania willdenowi]|uniref:suppressor of cytokine signaling 1-like isoform X2 n=1 Tax=Gouania willdenowi TaxID=441366 RepID=UPI001054BEA6|nr:suppressor of cytokine signaling 1-like isoform X2 [Gouania willdenowi]